MPLAQEIVKAVESVIGPGPHKLHEPLIGAMSCAEVDACIRSNHLSAGKVVERFERELARVIGARYCVATCSGTAALHAAYSVMFAGYKNEIQVPALTFVATANALVQLGHKIKFVDYMDAADVPVDILGHPVQLGGMLNDAAQALGSVRADGRLVGSTGTAVFSFNQNKTITTGGGGAVLTDDGELYTRLKHITTTARIADRWRVEHDEIAYNYRMPDINAAIGLGQLEDLQLILKAKRALAQKYIEAFRDISEARVWEEPARTKSNYWLVSLKFQEREEQQMALWALHNRGIQARMMPAPMHHLRMYEDYPRSIMSLTDNLYNTVICLPSSPKLGLQYVS